MDLGKFIFGEDASTAIKPYRDDYESAKEDLYGTFAKAFNDAEFYDENKELFDQLDKEIPGFSEQWLSGTTGQGLWDTAEAKKDIVNDAYNALGKAKRENKYNVFGSGILGTLLNPVVGAADYVADTGMGIAPMPISLLRTGQRYNKTDSEGFKESDLGQDLGNVISAGSTIAGGGALGSGASLGAKIATEAGLGALQNVGMDLAQGGEYTNYGDLAGSALTGAAFGAAIPALGAGASKLSSAVTNTGRNAIANQAMQQGYSQAMANQIAQNTGKGAQVAAGLGKVAKSKPFKVGAGAVAGGTLLSKLLGNRDASQTGYNDNATYGSDLYGTTQGYNYGTYGY